MSSPNQIFADVLVDLASKKPFEKISVSEIVSLSGLTRPTFYKYFSDKYDLALWIFEQHVQSARRDMRINHDFIALNRSVLTIMKQYSDFYKSLFRDTDSQNSFIKQFHSNCLSGTKNYIGAMGLSPETIAVYEVWTTGTDALIARWASNGMKESIDYLIDIFIRSMPEELKRVYFNRQDLVSS